MDCTTDLHSLHITITLAGSLVHLIRCSAQNVPIQKPLLKVRLILFLNDNITFSKASAKGTVDFILERQYYNLYRITGLQ